MGGGLDSVSMERNLSLAAQSPDFSDRLNRADLVICEHYRDKSRLIRDCVLNVLDTHEAFRIDRQISNVNAVKFFEILSRVQNRVMFNRSRD